MTADFDLSFIVHRFVLMFDEDSFPDQVKCEAVELFRRAYEAQQASAYGEAIELYRRSIETYPTAEAHTFLGWVYLMSGHFS